MGWTVKYQQTDCCWQKNQHITLKLFQILKTVWSVISKQFGTYVAFPNFKKIIVWKLFEKCATN